MIIRAGVDNEDNEDRTEYKFGIYPRRTPSHPRRPWTDWIRLSAFVVVLMIVTGFIVVPPKHWPIIGCSDGWPSYAVWESGDECVGVSDAPYAFELDSFESVLAVIDQQNQQAAALCPDGTPVTVGVLTTMTDPNASGRASHELEGIAAGQRRANGTNCLHPVRLAVGQIGVGGHAVVDVATELIKKDVVAVAGVGLSDQDSADAADLLAEARVPMVASLITAEGFDQNGSAQDRPDFGGCDPAATYRDGIGKDWYYRVSFRNFVQIEELAKHIGGRPDFIMVPTGTEDPYTCTTLPLMQRRFGGDIAEVKFTPEEPGTVPQTAKRVCNVPGDISLLYIARARDLARLLYSLDEQWSNGQCSASSVTVFSTSDATRLRATELERTLENLRTGALMSETFTDGRVKLLYPPLAATEHLRATSPNFDAFEDAFRDAGFAESHIDDGWAINGYDAMITIATALRTLPTKNAVTSSAVNTNISTFSSVTEAVPGAGGSIFFDNAGNRADTEPVVIRLCPLTASAARTTAVDAVPGQPVECG